MKILRTHYSNLYAIFLALLSFSLVEAVFWTTYQVFVGTVPDGIGRLARWWDIAIQPIWLLCFLLMVKNLTEGDCHITLIMLTIGIWVIGGICSIIFGFGILFPFALTTVGFLFCYWRLAPLFAGLFPKKSSA